MMAMSIFFYCIVNLYFSRFINADTFDQQKNSPWYKDGVKLIKENLEPEIVNKKAKGVILFIGDGMSIATVTAARILDGQLKGMSGEENVLSWERFKNVALSKTYNVDMQVPDSAGTATAFMTGVKSNFGTISVNENTNRGNCSSSKGNHLLSIIMMAEKEGLSTGVVTTARLTHATPATAYAHSAERNWENDAQVVGDCADIASQLIDFPYGDGLEVAFGGGRKHFMNSNTKDQENSTLYGKRMDGRNLYSEWAKKTTPQAKYEYVWRSREFKALDPSKVDHVLGLFNYDHMEYSYNRKKDVGGEPSLSEMVAFAVKVLEKNPKGYFLLVEGARIDLAHHDNKAFHALHDAVELAKAVDIAKNITDPNETLLIVTADHSHVFTMAGYQKRGTPIFNLTNHNHFIAKDNKRYSTLGYFNGPGAQINKERKAPTAEDLNNPEFQWESLVPLEIDTHGGDDVAIYARGCQSHLIRGVVEENYIFHVMDYALCLNEDKQNICRKQGLMKKSNNAAMSQKFKFYMIILVLIHMVV